MNNKHLVAIAQIQRLTHSINSLYQTARSERHQLARWEEDQDMSILGELEILTTDLQGYAGQFLSGQWNLSAETLSHLNQLNPFNVSPLSDWYITHSAAYPHLCRYIEQLDYLRLLLVEYAKHGPLPVAA